MVIFDNFFFSRLSMYDRDLLIFQKLSNHVSFPRLFSYFLLLHFLFLFFFLWIQITGSPMPPLWVILLFILRLLFSPCGISHDFISALFSFHLCLLTVVLLMEISALCIFRFQVFLALFLFSDFGSLSLCLMVDSFFTTQVMLQLVSSRHQMSNPKDLFPGSVSPKRLPLSSGKS